MAIPKTGSIIKGFKQMGRRNYPGKNFDEALELHYSSNASFRGALDDAVQGEINASPKLSQQQAKLRGVKVTPNTSNLPYRSMPGTGPLVNDSFLDNLTNNAVKVIREGGSGRRSVNTSGLPVRNAGPTGISTVAIRPGMMDDMVGDASDIIRNRGRRYPQTAQPSRVSTRQAENQARAERDARRQADRERRQATRQRRQSSVISGRLDGVKAHDTLFKSIGATSGTLGRSMVSNLSEKGALGKAFRGTVQSTALSAGVHGGLAYLQGDDPWEAAKTGAIRGAMAGAGYQGLKAATGTSAAFGKGGLKQIGTGLKDTYSAHTVAGQAAIRNNGQMSNQLKRILMAGKDTRIAEQVLLK